MKISRIIDINRHSLKNNLTRFSNDKKRRAVSLRQLCLFVNFVLLLRSNRLIARVTIFLQ